MRKSALALGLLLPLTACTSVPENAAPLSVSFSFSEANRCKPVSPSISVGGTPAGAATYKVSMRDRDVPSFNHGGGTVPANGVIPAGALKSFRGPCPPSGMHTYEIQVLALDASGKVIAAGTGTRQF